jgi:peptide/nickel transport system permease protein
VSAEVALKPWAGDVDRGSKKRSSRFLSKLTRSRTGLLGSMILALVVFCAIAAPYLAPFDPNYQTLEDRLIPPFAGQAEAKGHLLGTDHLGRDILSRLIYGSRVSLIVGLTAVTISCFMGCVLGLITGYQGGWIDEVIMRIGDVQLAFPFVLLVIAVVAVVGGGLLNEIIVIGITGWVGYARVIRGQVLSAREKEYVEAARAIGVRIPVILFRHILPNVFSPIIVLATFSVASVIILEAALTFLGLGVDPRTPTWGGMLADGRSHIFTSWWMTVIPGMAIFVTVLAINLLGDWLRDYLDPELRHLM